MRTWLITVAAMLVLALQGASAQGVVKLSSIEYPPYTGKGLKNGGVLTQIVREACAHTGWRLEVQYYPWARASQMAKSGEVDGVVPIWKRAEREEWFLFSNPMPASEVVFYTRARAQVPFEGTSYATLGPYRIGTCRDYADPEGLVAVRDQLSIEEVTDDLQNLRKLAAGRIDLAIIDRFVAQHLLRSKMPAWVDSLDWIRPALTSEPNYVGISRRAAHAQQSLEAINRGLEALREQGRIRQILTEHGIAE